jgi:CubicO group peptidase (beta-lactamase class C family)
MRLTGSSANIAGRLFKGVRIRRFVPHTKRASSRKGRLMVNELRLNRHRIQFAVAPRTTFSDFPAADSCTRGSDTRYRRNSPSCIVVGRDQEPDSPARDAFSMSKWKEPSQLHPSIDRRDFLGLASAAGAVSLPLCAAISVDAGHAALAQPQISGETMTRDIERFEKRLDLIRQSLDIPGMSVAVVHKQAVILARGFGVVDLANGTAATENTPYPIASLTKTFASAVIMRLVEAGKLDLDEAMSTYDPGYAQWCAGLKTRNHPAARSYNCDSERVTVRHHLTHTAQGKPGTYYEYNGFLFARLSAVVDALSARGLNRSIEEDILEPLGMRDTALGANDPHKADVVARMAKPYKLDQEGNLVEPATVNPPFDYMSAASGLISTVMDLAKYDAAIDRDIVYSAQTKQQIWTVGRSPTGRRFPYGLGWFVQEFSPPWPRLLWHYGWYSDAFSSLLLKMPDRQLTLILLACTDRASSVFLLGNGDALRSAFATAFLDTFGRNS